MTTGILLAHGSLALLIFLALPCRRLLLQGRFMLLFAAVAGSAVVVDGLSLGDYMRSYTGELAVTTLGWLFFCTVCRLRGESSLCERHKTQVAICFALLALVLYPATLGLSGIDPYRLGFSPAPLIAALAAVSVWLWWQRNHLGVVLLCFATLAYLADLKASGNYWDYLIDPIFGLYCCIYLLLYYGRRLQWPAAITFPHLQKRWRQLSTLGTGAETN